MALCYNKSHSSPSPPFGRINQTTIHTILLVEFAFDMSCNILFNVELFQSLCAALDSLLLHLIAHVGALDDGLGIRHGDNLDTLTTQVLAMKAPFARGSRSIVIRVMPTHSRCV